MKKQIALAAFALLSLLSFLVIYSPQIFYQTADAPKPILVKYNNVEVEYDKLYKELTAEAEATKERVAKLKKSTSYFTRDVEKERQIKDQEYLLADQQRELQALVQQKERILVEVRHFEPIFSQRMFDEARNLYWNVQTHQGKVSSWMTAFDVMFDSGGSEDLGGVLFSIVFRFLWNLSFGVIIGTVEFLIRLPFWISEYQLFTLPPEMQYAKGFDERRLVQLQNVYENVKPVESSTRWIDGILFYLLSFVGAVGGGIFLIVLIWSPLIACAGIVMWKKRQDPSAFADHAHANLSRGTRPTGFQPYQGREQTLHDD